MSASLVDAVRLWQTLRHLRPVQFYARARFHLVRVRPDHAPQPAVRLQVGSWMAPASRRPSLVGAQNFFLLNHSANLAEVSWDNPALDKLWRYNQHYFDDLNAHDADQRSVWHLQLLSDWVTRNPAGKGTGWEPYPTSQRIVNWIKWALAGNALPNECIQSLAVQARWLSRRLEWHLLGNHLFANAKALVFAGAYFQGPEAKAWLEKGITILSRELLEQILPDGGQFELSPMYHAMALEDVLDLVNLMRTYEDALGKNGLDCRTKLEARLPSMLSWLQAMGHPDGEIAFFNDAAIGVAPSPAELDGYAQRLGFELTTQISTKMWLKDSGYARLMQGDAVLLTDMARVGPDYLPGHAHADTLSFEFSLGSQRIFVNSGTSVYGTGAERQRQRGTAAHNTVIVAEQNSSDVWSGFRVGRRARPISPQVSGDGDILIADAGHDGYRHLPGRPIHKRRWQLASDRLVVEDHLSSQTLPAEVRFHLHPDVEVQHDGPSYGNLFLLDGRRLTWQAPGLVGRLAASTWHPEFGISQPNWCLVFPLREGRACLELSWA